MDFYAKLINTRFTEQFIIHMKAALCAIILIVATIITPTSDVFTLSLVTLPMWVLYEVSIVIVNRNAIHNRVE